MDETAALSAEEWLRAAWEDGPRHLRVVLPLAWRYGLGLRLGSTSDADRILGWHVSASSPTSVTVTADSRVLSAENVVTLDRTSLRWRTAVDYKNVLGRMVWSPTSVVHQWLVPRSLRRAMGDQGLRPPRGDHPKDGS